MLVVEYLDHNDWWVMQLPPDILEEIAVTQGIEDHHELFNWPIQAKDHPMLQEWLNKNMYRYVTTLVVTNHPDVKMKKTS